MPVGAHFLSLIGVFPMQTEDYARKRHQDQSQANAHSVESGSGLTPPPLQLKSESPNQEAPVQRFWDGITDWFTGDDASEEEAPKTSGDSGSSETAAAPGETGNSEVDAFVSDIVEGYIPSFEAANETLNYLEWWTDQERRLVSKQLKAWRASGLLSGEAKMAAGNALAVMADFRAEDMSQEEEPVHEDIPEEADYHPNDDAVDDEVPEEDYGSGFFDGEEIDPEEEEAYQKEQAENPGIIMQAIVGAVNGVIDLGHGVSRVAESSGFAGFNRSADIGEENERVKMLLGDVISKGAKVGYTAATVSIFEDVIAGIVGVETARQLEEMSEPAQEKIKANLASISINIASGLAPAMLGKSLVMKVIGKQIVKKAGQEIATSAAAKTFIRKASTAAATSASGIGALLSAYGMLGLFQRMSRASERLKASYPKLYKTLRKQNLDMMWVFVEPYLPKIKEIVAETLKELAEDMFASSGGKEEAEE